MFGDQSKEYRRIVVWRAEMREKSLRPDSGEKENRPLIGIGNDITHGWHGHPFTHMTRFWRVDSKSIEDTVDSGKKRMFLIPFTPIHDFFY